MTELSRNAPCHCGSENKYKVCCLTKDEANRKRHTGEDAVLVCMPTRGQICFETQIALTQNLGDVKHAVCIVGRKPVIEARNILAEQALRITELKPFPFEPREIFILWVDDDAWWQAGSVSTAIKAMHDMPSLDMLVGKFCARQPYANPVAYRKTDDINSFPREGVDCKFGEVVPIETAGFHWVLMRLSLLKRVGPNPFTPNEEHGEDHAFCKRVREVGGKMGFASGFPIFHVDPTDGSAYIPGSPAMMMDANGVRMLSLEHATPTGAIKQAEVRSYGLGSVEKSFNEGVSAERAALDAEMQQRRVVSAA